MKHVKLFVFKSTIISTNYMKKSDKKIDNAIRLSLTKVCEMALEKISGFQWLTHLVNYDNFPESLRVVCVFESNKQLAEAKINNQLNNIQLLIQKELATIGIKVKSPSMLVKFDSEENCTKQNNGKWHERLNRI